MSNRSVLPGESFEQYQKRMGYTSRGNSKVYVPQTVTGTGSGNDSPAESAYISPKLFDQPRKSNDKPKPQGGESAYIAPELFGDKLKGGRK